MREISKVLGLCISSVIPAAASAALTSINEGFESPAFTTGALNGQPSGAPAAEHWLVSGGATADATISNSDPLAGTQHVRLRPLDQQIDKFTGFFSPVIGIPDGTSTVTQFSLAINGVNSDFGSSDYDIVLADQAHGLVVSTIELSFIGVISITNSGSFIRTNESWNTGAYQDFEIDVAPSFGRFLVGSPVHA